LEPAGRWAEHRTLTNWSSSSAERAAGRDSADPRIEPYLLYQCWCGGGMATQRFAKSRTGVRFSLTPPIAHVAQRTRASGFHPQGREFESSRGPHSLEAQFNEQTRLSARLCESRRDCQSEKLSGCDAGNACQAFGTRKRVFRATNCPLPVRAWLPTKRWEFDHEKRA
jgi:hypothetical protein